MENKVDVSRELALAELKKETLGRSCELAHAQASSVLLFTIQWKDLEDHLDKTMKCVEEKGVEVDLKMKVLEERGKVVELKESELVSARNRIEECNGELEGKVRELESVRRSVEECRVELEGKEKELGLVRMRVDKCACEYEKRKGELDVLEKSVMDWTKKVSIKKEELSLVEDLVEKFLGEIKERDSLQKAIRECCEQLESRKSELSEIEKLTEARKEELAMEVHSFKSIVQEYREELEVKEHDFRKIEKSIQERNMELESRRKELKLTEDHLEELHSQAKKLELLENDARRRIEEKEVELNAVTGKVKKYSIDIEKIEREFDVLCKLTNEQAQELSLKKKEQNSVQESIEKCTKELKVKEELIMSIEKSLLKCSEELELKKKHLSSVENSVEELNDEHLSEELELVFVKTMTSQYLKELKEKEEHFNSFKNSLTERWKDLEVKEEQFEERVKEFELKEKQLSSTQKIIEEQREKLEMQEKHLTSIRHPQGNIEQPKGSNEGMDLLCPNLESCIMSNGRKLQMLMNEQLKKNDLFLDGISYAIKKARDPGKLVLDAMQGFFPLHLQDREGGLDVISIRRTCILLLEYLLSFSPHITPQVRNDALKLAGEWKVKMTVAVDHSLEVVGFLLLVAAFGLASDFDGNELQKLLDIVDLEKQKPELIHALRIANRSPVKHILPSQVKTEQSEHTLDSNTIDALSENCLQLSTTNVGSNVNEHDLLPSEVSAALLVSPDPAKFVLDFIQGSYSENEKKGSTNMEEGVIRIYILLLERLKDVLPKINPQVKAQARKLAVEWRSKMRVVTENSLVVLVFLLFLATYELVTFFDREEILKLLFTVARCKQAPEICRALGFTDMAPDFVHDLIGRNQHLKAVRFIYAFNLMDIISPEAVFKQYLNNVRTTACNMYIEGNNFLDTKGKAIDFETAALRALIECLEECKLESLIGIDNIRNCIVMLEKQKENLNHSLPASNPPTLQLLQGNFGSSAITNQPPCRPILQPQHGEKNHSASACAPGSVQDRIVKLEKGKTQWDHHMPAPDVMTLQQLQSKNCNSGTSTQANQPASGPMFYQQHGQQNRSSSLTGNSQKRPRIDPYTPQVPAPVNPYAGLKGRWYGPAVPTNLGHGVHQARTWYTSLSGGRGQVGDNPSMGMANWDVRYPYHF